MCGIAGIFSYRSGAKPVDGEELVRIRDSMARRGPDGAGLWLSPDRRIGLAHRRLAIIDLSDNGAQPMTSSDGSLHITFNGEIYNYRQLKSELEAKGYAFRSSSDTEVMLHLYADRGPDMVHALRGMYAFALWDERKKGLLLARDAFGIKPLYYADDGASLRFASQVKALLHGGAISPHPEPAGYVGFLTWGCVPEPFTLHREIRALPSGSHLWIDQGGAKGPTRFFSVRDEFLRAEELAESIPAHEAVQRVLEALKDSVAHHLVADVPVAAFLSAGLDSATTVALASDVSKRNLRTLTLGFQEYSGTPNDETALAALVSARFGATHETRWVQRSDFDDDLERILDAMDQPSTDGVNTYLVSKAAAGAGMKVALSGLGGDELFAGYPSFADVPRIRNLAKASAFSPAAGRWLRKLLSPILGGLSSPKYAGLLEYGGTYGGAYLLRRSLFMPWEIEEILEPDVAAQGWRDLQTLPHLAQDIQGLRSSRSIVSTLELDWYMRNQLLRDSDWAGMAHSLEIRVPYVDVTFFRAVLPVLVSGLPIGKTDVASALHPPLPDEVLKRGKTGFLVPVQQWCATRPGEGALDRGLRGWARIVIGKDLSNISDGSPRLGRGKIFAFPERDRRSHARPPDPWHRTQAAAVKAAYRLVNGFLGASAIALWPRKRPATASRVCVFRIGNIGDIVCSLPAIRCIRKAYPDAHLTLLTSPGPGGMPGAADVLEECDWIDELRAYHSEDIDSHSKRAALLKEMRERRFDVWIDLPNNLTTITRQFRDMAFTRIVGAKWARGWRIDTLKWAAQAQTEHLHFPNEVERMLAVVRRAGIPVEEIDFGMGRPARVVARIDRLMSERDLAGRNLVAIAPGAKRSTNLWLSERFAQVAQQLSESGFVPVFLGGKGEAQACAALSAIVGGRCESFAGELSVSESCELLRRCHLLVCLDSGVQHIASAVGTPCISLFSFWQMRGKWRPHGSRNVVLQKWVPCHTCLLEECPNGNRCMKAIEVHEVMFHAKKMLDIGTASAMPETAAREASG
jgi:asparagine synthase (glutamine-hydrolysing)